MESQKKKQLNSRQKAFADNYIISGNATEAYKKAGYSEKYADTNASKLLENTRILEYIKQRTAPAEEKRIASGDEVLMFLTRVMNGEENANMTERISAGREILKRDISDKKLSIELLKLEAKQEDRLQEDVDDTLIRALDSAAVEVWGGDGCGGTTDGCPKKEDNS